MLEPSCSSAGLGFLTPGASCHPQPTHSAHRNLNLVIPQRAVWLLDREQWLLSSTQFRHNCSWKNNHLTQSWYEHDINKHPR